MSRRWLILVLFFVAAIGASLAFIAEQIPRVGMAPGVIVFLAPLGVALATRTFKRRDLSINLWQVLGVALLFLILGGVLVWFGLLLTVEELAVAVISVFATLLFLIFPILILFVAVIGAAASLAFIAEQIPRVGMAPGVIVFLAPLGVALATRTFKRRDLSINLWQVLGITLLFLILGGVLAWFGLLLTVEELAVAVVSVFAMLLFLIFPNAARNFLIAVGALVLIAAVGLLLVLIGQSWLPSPIDGIIFGISATVTVLVLSVSIWIVRSNNRLLEERLGSIESTSSFDPFERVEEDINFVKMRESFSIRDRLSLLTFRQSHLTLLSKLNVPLTTAEYTALRLLLAGILFAFTWVVFFNNDLSKIAQHVWTNNEFLASAAAVSLGYLLPQLVLYFAEQRRQFRFYQQLSNTLSYMINAFSQGYSVLEGMGVISKRVPNPTAEEFNRVVIEQRLGLDFDETLSNLADRAPVFDFRAIVQGIRIQRRRGGNLVQLLQVVRDLVESRAELSRSIVQYKGWTARIPFVFLCAALYVQWELLPSYWQTVWENTLGNILMIFTYALFALLVLWTGTTTRRLRQLQRKVGIPFAANREIIIELALGSVLILGLWIVGVPFLLVFLLALILMVNLLGLGLSITIITGLLVLAVVFEPYIQLNAVLPLNSIQTGLPTDDLQQTLPPLAEFWNQTNVTISAWGLSLADFFVRNWFVWIVLTIFLLLAMIYAGLRINRDYDPFQERLKQYGDRELPTSIDQIKMSLSFRNRVFVPMMDKIRLFFSRFTPQSQFQNTEELLDRARILMSPLSFTFSRFLYFIGFAVGGIAIGQAFFKEQPYLVTIVLVIALISGYMLPWWILRVTIAQRYNRIADELPGIVTVFDMYTTSGESADMTMLGIYAEMEGELPLIFGRILREVQLGKTRSGAYRDAIERIQHPDFEVFLTALLISDQLGDRDTQYRIQNVVKYVRENWFNQMQERIVNYARVSQSLLYIGTPVVLVLWLIVPLIIRTIHL